MRAALAGPVIVGILIALSVNASAQTRPANPYRTNTAEEDWTFLKTVPKTDIWDPLKYIDLGHEDWSLTLSGEIRYRPEAFRVFGPTGTAARDGYLLQRYLFGADVRFGPRFRIFSELQGGIVNGKLQTPRPTDQDPVDVHQAFFEWRQPVREKDQFVLTVGRQEIEIGSSRLISASPGLNVKRSFDGVVASYRRATWNLVGAVAELVGLETGNFDDTPDSGQQFWGVALTRNGPSLLRSQLGIYYLGIDNHESTYAQGRGHEVRHTLGLKWNGSGNRVDLNYDGLFQWGQFADASIVAWAFATETGYRFADVPWRPRVSARSDVASGDRDASSGSLQSFNPLFPGNAYSGAIGLLGPTNLTDLTPAFTIFPRRDLVVSFEAPNYWRTSEADGVYSTNLQVLAGPDKGTGHYVGTNPGLLAVWQATPHLQLQGVVTRFLSGTFLERTFVARGFGFYSFTARYRF